MMIPVYVIAPTGLACDAIATALQGEKDIQVIGRATGYHVALPVLPEESVVLIDVGGPDPEVLKLIQRTYREHPGDRVVVFGVPEVPGIVLDYLEAGARGYVPRDASMAGLVERVRAVARDEVVMTSALAGLLARRVAGLSRLCADNDLDASRASALSPREREVLRYIARGRGNQEISRSLGIGVGTVKNHVHSILRKLGVSRREDAGLYFRLFAEERPDNSS
jgi:DNA-binding NarL/FixJ family response regulator